MNKRIQKYGTILFDYMFITILLNISIVLVIPFIPVVIGLTKYFSTEANERSLILIYSSVKDNLSRTIQITIFLLSLYSVSIINLFVIDTEYPFIQSIINGISYFLMIIGVIIFIHMGAVINYMNVTFKELLYNSIMLAFGGLINFLTSIGLVTIFLYAVSQSYLVFVFGISFVIYWITRLSYLNLKKLKERKK